MKRKCNSFAGKAIYILTSLYQAKKPQFLDVIRVTRTSEEFTYRGQCKF